MSLSSRVARVYVAKSIGDAPTIISALSKVLEIHDKEDIPYLRRAVLDVGEKPYILSTRYNQLSPEDQKLVEAYRKAESLGYAVSLLFDSLRRYGAGELYLALLQQYEIPANLRRKVEQAAKCYSKSRVNRPPRDRALDVFQKELKTHKEYLDVARQVVLECPLHTEAEDGGSKPGTRVPAGPFTVVNTGGFPPEVIKTVVSLVEKATTLLQQNGMGKVCYGDILVSNTVGRNARVLAFYLIQKDEMFIRANLKGSLSEALHTILHELAHRMQHQFLASKKRDIHFLYQALARKTGDKDREELYDRSKWPQPGETLTSKGKTYEVTGIEAYTRSGPKVNLKLQTDPATTASISLAGWLDKKGVRSSTGEFVSEYAKTSPDENFAEMCASLCLGQLSGEPQEKLEAILKG